MEEFGYNFKGSNSEVYLTGVSGKHRIPSLMFLSKVVRIP